MENEIATKIKNLRRQQNLTLEEVGNAVGVGKSTVRKWETGMIANMKRDKILLLAKALHTTPEYLMGWETPENKKSAQTDGLTEKKQKLIDFALAVPEDKIELVLTVMKSIVEADL